MAETCFTEASYGSASQKRCEVLIFQRFLRLARVHLAKGVVAVAHAKHMPVVIGRGQMYDARKGRDGMTAWRMSCGKLSEIEVSNRANAKSRADERD